MWPLFPLQIDEYFDGTPIMRNWAVFMILRQVIKLLLVNMITNPKGLQKAWLFKVTQYML